MRRVEAVRCASTPSRMFSSLVCKKYMSTNSWKPKLESPYVHRGTAYVADLRRNWAYQATHRKPRLKLSQIPVHSSEANATGER